MNNYNHNQVQVKQQLFRKAHQHPAYGRIKLDYNHEGGICISELRTVDADDTSSVLRTWTLVPFWLDKNCDRDGGDGKYYRGDGTEGQLKCWGTTREFGFGAGVENKRAISVTTCDNSTKLAGTKGGLSANVKMLRDGSEIIRNKLCGRGRVRSRSVGSDAS